MRIADTYEAARHPGTYCQIFADHPRGSDARNYQAAMLRNLRAHGGRLIKYLSRDGRRVLRAYEYPIAEFGNV